jgi:hypothetical protein
MLTAIATFVGTERMRRAAHRVAPAT